MSQEQGYDGEAKPRRRSSGVWKWVLLGCGGLGVLGLLCAGAIALIVWNVLQSLSGRLDQLHAEALAGGNVEKAYDNADPRFKQAYSRQQFADFCRNNPGVLQRDIQTARSLKTMTRDGDNYVLLFVDVGTGLAAARRGFVCTTGPDGKLRLLGIDPDLTAAVPPAVLDDLRRTGRGEDRD